MFLTLLKLVLRQQSLTLSTLFNPLFRIYTHTLFHNFILLLSLYIFYFYLSLSIKLLLIFLNLLLLFFFIHYFLMLIIILRRQAYLVDIQFYCCFLFKFRHLRLSVTNWLCCFILLIQMYCFSVQLFAVILLKSSNQILFTSLHILLLILIKQFVIYLYFLYCFMLIWPYLKLLLIFQRDSFKCLFRLLFGWVIDRRQSDQIACPIVILRYYCRLVCLWWNFTNISDFFRLSSLWFIYYIFNASFYVQVLFIIIKVTGIVINSFRFGNRIS